MDMDTKPASKKDELQLPWVEKYRPSRCERNNVSLPISTTVAQCPLSLFTLPFLFYRLEDLVAHDDIISIITKLIDSDNLPHLLFYGPPGTGKVQLTDLQYSRAIQDCYISLSLN
jgi:hypothetical protein